MVIKNNNNKYKCKCKSISFSSETLHSVAAQLSLLTKVLFCCKIFFLILSHKTYLVSHKISAFMRETTHSLPNYLHSVTKVSSSLEIILRFPQKRWIILQKKCIAKVLQSYEKLRFVHSITKAMCCKSCLFLLNPLIFSLTSICFLFCSVLCHPHVPMGLSDAFIFFIQIYIYFLLYFSCNNYRFWAVFHEIHPFGIYSQVLYRGDFYLYIFIYICTHTCSCGSVVRALR